MRESEENKYSLLRVGKLNIEGEGEEGVIKYSAIEGEGGWSRGSTYYVFKRGAHT